MILIAQSEIIYGNKKYQPGDLLPADEEMGELWLSSEAACEFKDIEVGIKLKGKRRTALSGLYGKALNGECEYELVGRVPINDKRRRK